jgi:hypothetical protein
MSLTPEPVSSASTQGFAQTVRILAAALLGAPVLLGLVLALVGSTDPDTGESWTTALPDPVLSGLLVVAGVALLALLPTFGYRLPVLERGTDPEVARRAARGRFQSAMVLRFAFAEAPMLVGLALAFVDQSYPMFLIGAVTSLLLMLLHVWPSRRVVERSAEVHHDDVTRTTKGQEVTRHGSDADPAYVIEQEDGTVVLKLASEVERA